MRNHNHVSGFMFCVMNLLSPSPQRCFPKCMNIIMMPTLTDVTLKGHTHNESIDYDTPSGDPYGWFIILSVD